MSNKIDEIKTIVLQLNKAEKAYYSGDGELMSNFEYDNLYDKLEAMERETGIIMATSPTQRVGYETLSSLPKEKHDSKMLSLAKTKSLEDLKSWIGNQKGLLSWKLDGLTVVLTYDNGSLNKAVTRGNGEVGEVITQNAKAFINLPLKIPYSGKLVIRGEAVISYDDFREINESLTGDVVRYKNPRNLCAGSVRQLSNKVTSERRVRFFAFSLVSAMDMDFKNSRDEKLKWLISQGFETVEYQKVTASDIEATVISFEKRVADNDIPSDGLVLTYDDIAYSKSLGETSKFPRDSIAFKWKDDIARTKLLAIEWNASRTGLVNPIAVFEPVELEGTSVTRASLHNVSILKDFKLGIGDEIEVYKANMIIPQVARNLTQSDTLILPKNCPACSSELVLYNNNGVSTLNCLNTMCSAKHIKKFTLFVSRDGLNIEGLSEATIEKFIAIGTIKEYADIFKLKEHKDKIVALEGFGEKSFDNIISAVEKARSVKPENLLYALGIPGVGLSNAKLISGKCKNSWDDMVKLDYEKLIEIDGIGEIVANAYISYFSDSDNAITVNNLVKELAIDESFEHKDTKLQGMTFVITGSLYHYENRKELKEIIERAGGKVASAVSGNTSFLINNDVTSSSGKNKKAKELGIKIIDENTIKSWVEEGYKE